MKKNNLLKFGESVIRILEIEEDRIFVIDCIKQTMPYWISASSIREYEACSQETLLHITHCVLQDVESLDAKSKKIMYQRYTMIVGMLPVITDEKMRSHIMDKISKQKGIGKQTIRKHLILYLIYQDISVLVPKRKTEKDTLTQDQKNMRWALNKFFYNQDKNSIATAYTLMLKEKYCDDLGNLLPNYPSIYQFRYFYKTHKKLQNYYISRNGLKNYQRNNRPLIGEGVQQFAPNIGVGMLDATICDIYLVNEAGNLVGRPILTACIDAYSSLCYGYSLTWEGGTYSLRNLMLNVIYDKVEHCRQFGINIDAKTWDCSQLPGILVSDMGREYVSETFEQIAELGVTLINLPAYRPELKGSVEKFFDLIQQSYKKYLKGKGVIEPDFQERGSHDYRKDACLRMEDFEKIILHCILYYNSQRIIENFPYTEDMLEAKIEPYANCLWNWGIKQTGANLIPVDKKQLIFTLLPRTEGKFSRFGLKVNKLRYHCEGYTESYLRGGVVMVAYNPDDVSMVWVIEKGKFVTFELIDSRFKGKPLIEVENMLSEKKKLVKNVAQDNLQAQIDLAEHIMAIANSANKNTDVNMKAIRDTRKREQTKRHIDYMREGGCDD